MVNHLLILFVTKKINLSITQYWSTRLSKRYLWFLASYPGQFNLKLQTRKSLGLVSKANVFSQNPSANDPNTSVLQHVIK